MRVRTYACRLTVVAAMLLAYSGRAHADTITVYTYTGNILGNTGGTVSCGGCTITGEFAVANPLGANFGSGVSPDTQFSNVTPLSFSFTDGHQAITTDPLFFGITTDAFGAIRTWYIIIGLNTATEGQMGIFNIGNNGLGDESISHAAGYGDYNYAPGTWTERTETVTATPEPASLLLLGSGLSIGCRRLRRRSKSDA